VNTTRFQFRTEGFIATPPLFLLFHRGAARIFRHLHPRPYSVALHVKYETPHQGPPQFTAWGVAGSPGPDHVVHAAGNEPGPAVTAALRKLERSVIGAAGLRKQRRHRLPRERTTRS
jgi:hypothetical protein